MDKDFPKLMSGNKWQIQELREQQEKQIQTNTQIKTTLRYFIFKLYKIKDKWKFWK